MDEIDETIREIRTSIFALEAHHHPGLRSEVIELVEEIADRAGFEPHVTFDGPIDAGIDPEVVSDLLAVLREALSNVARHAEATRVDISLTSTHGVELRVSDDGKGIDATFLAARACRRRTAASFLRDRDLGDDSRADRYRRDLARNQRAVWRWYRGGRA